MNKLSKFVSRLFSPLDVIMLAMLFGSVTASAQNSIPLKPDSANAAPSTVVGSPYGETDFSGMIVLMKTAAGTSADSTHGLYVSSQIVVTSPYMTVISSGGAIVITAKPSISTSTVLGGVLTEFKSGTVLVLSSTDTVNCITLQDDGTLSGSKLELASATRVVCQYDILGLIYDAADHFWRELFYSNN